jgi:hypothetical protein
MKKLSVLFLKLLCALSVSAQVGTVAGGGDGTSNSGSIAFSLGQIDFAAASNGTGAINAGIQQPYEIFVSAVDKDYAQLKMELFPNPVTHFLNLSMGELIPNLHYQLISLDGRLLQDVEVTQDLTQIDLQALPAAAYILNILDDAKTVKIFKVIKK